MVVSLGVIRDLIKGLSAEGLWPYEICKALSRYLSQKTGKDIKLPFWVRFYLAVRGYYPVLTVKTDNWGPIEFHILKCPEHGLVVSYPHGYERRLECPLCMSEVM